MNLGKIIKRGLPIVLPVMASLGVGLTAYFAVKATSKAEKLIKEGEKKISKAVLKCYIPAITIGLSTIACVVGASIINEHQRAEIISAYALVRYSYKEYRDKVKAKYGADADEQIADSIVIKNCSGEHEVAYDKASTLFDFDIVIDNTELIRTFYDNYSERPFESTVSAILQAEYLLNRELQTSGEACLNAWYEYLGLPPITGGDEVGWSATNYFDFLWVDFTHEKLITDDGLEIITIDMIPEPCLLNAKHRADFTDSIMEGDEYLE